MNIGISKQPYNIASCNRQKKKKKKNVGECNTDIETLKKSVGRVIPIIQNQKGNKKVDDGSFIVESFRISELTPYREYVSHVAVAIDFFYDNSKFYPKLHKEGEMNNYEHVLSSVLEVLIQYSCDDSIASYALGYSYKTKFRICGNLSLDDYVLFLHGIDEVVSTYKTNVKKVSL